MTVSNRLTVLFVFAVISIIAGAIFIQQGISKYILIKQLAATEKVSIGLSEDQMKQGYDFIEQDAVSRNFNKNTHRQKYAVTVTSLEVINLSPKIPKQLYLFTAINLENYLYLGVLSSE